MGQAGEGKALKKEMKEQEMREDTALPEETRALCRGFEAYEDVRGIKKREGLLPHLRPFFRYLDERGLTIEGLSFRQAQEFQTYLSTLETKDGSLRYAAYTIATIMSIVNRFYTYLRSSGKVLSNPFSGIKRIRVEKKLPRNIPEEEQMNDLLECLRRFWKQQEVRRRRLYYRSHVMAEVLYATGLRISEVLSLKQEEIDFEEKTVLVKGGKGGKERKAYLTEYACRVLRVYVEEMRDAVIVNRNSGRVFGVTSPATISATFHRVLAEEGKKRGIGALTTHDFRHTLGYHLLKRGCDMRYIQLVLGHEDMNTTTIYTKVTKADLRAELDRFHPRRFGGKGDG